MKGKLIKRDNNWYVTHIMDDNGVIFGVDYPLSSDDIKQIEADAQIFDNIEARISAYPDVIFEIITIDNGDNGVRYAKLQPKRIGKMTEEEWVAAEKQK